MTIQLSKYAGFCEGVKRAYNLINSFDMQKAKNPVYILGALVHNPAVNKEVKEKGIHSIKRKDFLQASAGDIGTLIITAHGIGPDIYSAARKKNIAIVDTTCPKVIKVQKLAKFFGKIKYTIVIVGDREHKEVQGIDDWGGGKSVIISDEDDLKNIDLSQAKKIAVLSQTTQNEIFFKKAAHRIQNKYPARLVKMFNTTCDTTQRRQKEVKELARKNGAVLVIGSETSANSRRLFEISRSLNPKSYFIDRAEDINQAWFLGIKKVGLTAGASTPPWIVKEVVAYLKNM